MAMAAVTACTRRLALDALRPAMQRYGPAKTKGYVLVYYVTTVPWPDACKLQHSANGAAMEIFTDEEFNELYRSRDLRKRRLYFAHEITRASRVLRG